MHPLIYALLLLTALSLFSSSPSLAADPTVADSSNRPLRVMTFNIRYANPGDGNNIWANRKDMVASMVRFHEADLIGMQEALRDQILDLEQRLPGYKWIGSGRNDGKQSGEFVPIFYRTDRLELLDQSAFWLSETPEVPGSKSWDAAITRMVTVAKFKDRESGSTFHHLNTHFDHIGTKARHESATILLRKAEELSSQGPVIVTGDFNCLAEHSPYKILTGQSVDDATPPDESEESSDVDAAAVAASHNPDAVLYDTRYRSALPHHGPNTTWNGFLKATPGMTIDYIFTTSNIEVHSHGVLTDSWDSRFPSDHFPILAELSLPSGK